MTNNLKQENNLNNLASLNEILEKINNEIFDEKIWIGEKMWKIAEVTYSYDSTQKINNKNVDINFTLFSEIGGLNLENFSNLTDEEKIKKIIKSFLNLDKKINDKKEQISKMIEILENLKVESKEKKESYLKEIVLEALKEKINLLDYCLYGLPFELEKAGVEIYNNEINKENLKQKLNNLDKILFGGEIKENPEEVKIAYKNLFLDFEENKEKLTKKEQERYLYFLEKAKKILPDNFSIKAEKKPESLLKKEKEKTVSQDNYIEYFQNSVNNIGGKYKILTNNEAGSISDGPKSIEFPTKKEFQNLDLARILKLEQHEILTHCITDLNNSKILGNLRGAKSTEKDEGLAIFMENIFEFGKGLLKKDEKTGKMILDLEKFNIPRNFSLTFIGEILENKELKEFLELQEKMGLLNNSPKERFLRLKRSNFDGVQHKDTTYFRGLVKVIEEINKNILSDGKDGLNFYDFFIGKCGIEDIKKMILLNDLKNNGDFTKPNFSPDKTIFVLNGGENEEDFIKYLKEKYPFINFLEQEIRNMKENILKIIKE